MDIPYSLPLITVLERSRRADSTSPCHLVAQLNAGLFYAKGSLIKAPGIQLPLTAPPRQSHISGELQGIEAGIFE